MVRRRTVREDERDLWQAVTRDVLPLVRAAAPLPDPLVVSVGHAPVRPRESGALPSSPTQKRRETSVSPLPLTQIPPAHSDLSSGETAQRRYFLTRGGKYKQKPTELAVLSAALHPERKLDLHGMVAHAAFLRLFEFLYSAHKENVQCVEIITGLGSGTEGGILRRELPMWLEHPDLRWLVHSAAYPHPTNRGAVRVKLRRGRRTGR